MKESVIRDFMLCPACHHETLETTAFDRQGEDVVNGVVTCAGCGAWYRLDDGLLELLVPSLQDAARRKSFQSRFATRWNGWKTDIAPSSAASDAHKLGQIEFYDEDAAVYEIQMMEPSFWRGFDIVYHGLIDERAGKRDVMLEIGCGTGRVSLPMAEDFGQTLSFDLSEAMVRTALGKRDKVPAALGRVHYFVADAENIPIRAASIDVAIFSGILHHVESPDVVLREMARTLKDGATFFGQENNRSAFRPIFDFLMRKKKLWDEKAHEDHFVMSAGELRQWFASAGVESDVWTSVFLPPHLFNFFSAEGVARLMKITDAIAHAIPWWKHQGGLVLFAGQKKGGATPRRAPQPAVTAAR